MTDADKILNYLSQGNSLTFNDCQRIFGSNSLRERVKDLRRRGIKIVTRNEKNPSTGRYHAVYSLGEPSDTPQEEIIRRVNLAQETVVNRKAFEDSRTGQLQFIG